MVIEACQGRRVIEWRLRVCMAVAGIRFASDLHRRLAEVLGDAGPSEAQVSRLVRSPPERLNLRTLAALCEVLDCEPADLLHRSAGAHPDPVTDHRQVAR